MAVFPVPISAEIPNNGLFVGITSPCIIESPFKGANKAEEWRNRAYLNKLIRHVTLKGYTPYASHKMLVDSFNDDDESERTFGIHAGLFMATKVILVAFPEAPIFFGLDYGETDGMKNKARPLYEKCGFSSNIVELYVGKL